MDPRLNPSFDVGVRPWVWTLGEFVLGAISMATILVGLRPLLRFVFGSPVIAPFMCFVLSVCVGVGVLIFLLSWRLAEQDRDEYAYLTWRRLVVRKRAYNVLEPNIRFKPLAKVERHGAI